MPESPAQTSKPLVVNTLVRSAFDRVKEVYLRLEPPGHDTWNPIHDDVELWHRVRLLLESCHVLRQLSRPLNELRVLDAGCGVGRSTRLLIDLGAKPSHIVAIDLRPAALVIARACNPAVDWRSIDSLDEWPSERFDLAVQCTVFSSIPTEAARVATAELMEQSVGDDGHILWWDSRTANDFAGGDGIDPRRYFGSRELICLREVALLPSLEEALRPLRGLRPLATCLLAPLGHRRTHCIALFGPRRQGLPAETAPSADAAPESVADGNTLLRSLPLQSAQDAGLSLGAWEVFQHRPLLETYAKFYGHEVIEVDGILVVIKKLPMLGAIRAQVYSPEAAVGTDWPRRLQQLPVGELVVMTNEPAGAGWPLSNEDDLVSMVIDLRGDEGALLGRFEKRAHHAMRRGERGGLSIHRSTSSEELAAVHSIVHRKSAGGVNFPLVPLGLLQVLLSLGQGTLYVARLEGRVVGGCVVLRHRYAHALVSGFDAEAADRLPSTLMYVEIMRHEQAQGMPFLDFGPHNAQAHRGLVLAKRTFGPLIIPAYRYERPGVGWRPKVLVLAARTRRLLRTD
jgi:SAM-dependent methyltransferase